jgi:thiamine pyrophosphate-dependent acetolactate synthase large subunit-like protein
MAARTGRHAIIEQLLADDIHYMFGNPGTVEQGFLDSLEDYSDFHYILTLQETVAVGIADGYARATKKPTVVQLHSGVGLGNGIGMIYQAMRGHAPLVVLAGESGIRYDALDAQMAADLVGMARPVTKWATRVVDPTSLLRVLRRAIKMAATPPMGPVFVALPMDVLDAANTEPVVPSSTLVTRVAPEADSLAQAAAWLAGAQHPMIIMGDGIAVSGAQAELARVAELLGAEVWGADSSEVNIADSHPLFRGLLGHMFGEHSRGIIAPADVVLVTGTYTLPEVFPVLEGLYAQGTKVIHVDLNAYEIAKNFPVDLGIVSDPKLTLARLAEALEATQSEGQKEAAKARTSGYAAAKEEAARKARATDAANRDAAPMHAARFMEELAAQLPPDAIIFDEALTTSPDVTRYIPPNLPGHYFQTRGGSLGVGLPGALGIKVANPDKTVIAFTGDGGMMYTPQALWTAAHHHINAKFVVCNNQSYLLLKLNIMQYWKERGIEEHAFPKSFDLADPVVRFDELARSLGVQAVRVETPDQIGPAIRQALDHDGPFLIDLIITNEVPGSKPHPKGGQ